MRAPPGRIKRAERVAAVANAKALCRRRQMSGTATGILEGKKKPPAFAGGSVFALPIFPGSRPPSIVGVHELNFCVRDGNRWTLMTINTNSKSEEF